MNELDEYNKEFHINCFYHENINNQTLPGIYQNISIFNKHVANFKNILFICSDYPGYGGAATNCYKLMQYYQSKGHRVYGIFYIFKEDNLNIKKIQNQFKTDDKISIIRNNILRPYLKRLRFKPDLIILRNSCHVDIKKIFPSSLLYYLIAGIFRNNLDKFYYELQDKNEAEKYINFTVIDQIKKSDISFCNSLHTSELIKKYYNLDTKLLYFGFFPFEGQMIQEDTDFKKRKYDYGIICSNFDRKIKNIPGCIDKIEKGKKCILLGKNSNKYKKDNIECINDILTDTDEIYRNVKYIINCSFFESCSNVILESKFNGCEIIS